MVRCAIVASFWFLELLFTCHIIIMFERFVVVGHLCLTIAITNILCLQKLDENCDHYELSLTTNTTISHYHHWFYHHLVVIIIDQHLMPLILLILIPSNAIDSNNVLLVKKKWGRFGRPSTIIDLLLKGVCYGLWNPSFFIHQPMGIWDIND